MPPPAGCLRSSRHGPIEPRRLPACLLEICATYVWRSAPDRSCSPKRAAPWLQAEWLARSFPV
jgi:hypothetical protein